MIEIRTYSIEELDELTGFNQRTISYYIQQGLLPKVGRRGRSTRYPQLFVDRLNFIKRVRELQDAGRLGSVTLPRIARVLWYLVERSDDPQALPEVTDEEIQRLFSEETVPDARELGETEAGERATANFGKFGPYVRVGQDTASIEAEEFHSITLDEALDRIATSSERRGPGLIQEFRDQGIQVLDGRYGPYVRHRGINARVPSNLDPTQLTAEDCRALIDKQEQRLQRKSASQRRDRLAARVKESRSLDESFDEPVPVRMMSLSLEAPRMAASESARDELRSRLSRAELTGRRLDTKARELLDAIEDHASNARRSGGQTETWTRAPITKNIEIAVQGIEPENADLVESLAKTIRELLDID